MPEAAGEPLKLNARVVAGMPNALYRLELQDESRSLVTAHLAGGAGMLRVLPGDLVVVELLPFDMTRGRIVRKR